MQIERHFSLLGYNTFGLPAEADYFVSVKNEAELRAALQAAPARPIRILGGGSNILFANNPSGLLIKNDIKGIEVVREFPNRVWVKAGGGEAWHELVMWAVRNHYGGIENLSLIPGSVGAAPVQNIGAYGVEIKDVLVRLEAIRLSDGKKRIFTNKACAFGYRDSIFKKEAAGQYCIVSVVFSLSKNRHRIHTGYGDIQKTLAAMGIERPGIADVSKAVVAIRSAKLPDPAKIGNCGSFFKNPELDAAILTRLLPLYPQMPHYPLPEGRVKIPAGWLIEQCGWKGKRIGNTGCYEKQALVIVNHGGANGEEVRRLAHDIIASVKEKFGVDIEPEVNIW